ncbi:MAG: SHOCT domain-containing protein [Spirosoma sp.]|nr:SHOCT domain-containing protein [Spirosoma sp.]
MDQDVLLKLERLAKLKEQGALSELEFQQQKKTLMGQSTPMPRPKSEKTTKSKSSWLKWSIIAVCSYMAIAIVIKCSENEKAIDSIAVATAEPTKSSYYTILEQTTPGNFSNYEILIDSKDSPVAQALVCAKIFKIKECENKTCNVVGLWDDERAYKLWNERSNDPLWRKKNWVFMCEHYVAEYNATVGEINIYPFMDSEYRRWGGKKKRPPTSSFDM